MVRSAHHDHTRQHDGDPAGATLGRNGKSHSRRFSNVFVRTTAETHSHWSRSIISHHNPSPVVRVRRRVFEQKTTRHVNKTRANTRKGVKQRTTTPRENREWCDHGQPYACVVSSRPNVVPHVKRRELARTANGIIILFIISLAQKLLDNDHTRTHASARARVHIPPPLMWSKNNILYLLHKPPPPPLPLSSHEEPRTRL